MHELSYYKSAFLDHLENQVQVEEPRHLYEPAVYMLNLGGKRLRPILVLMASELFEAPYTKALDAALAIEVFHNFTLVHDDIMDAAPLRRGKKTVHEVWDTNTGILSGDVMLIQSFRFLESYSGQTYRRLMELLSKTAQEVCEGQQYDLDFEVRDDVSIQEYLKMIEYKTAVLVGAALKMGGIISGTSKENTDHIFEFGRLLGIAFQLQDDYLDVFGDPDNFGKQIGGDIIENKKTYLYLIAKETSGLKVATQLEHLYSLQPPDPSAKIEAVKGLFEASGAAMKTQSEIEKFTEMAFDALEKIQADPEKKERLREFGRHLMNRNA